MFKFKKYILKEVLDNFYKVNPDASDFHNTFIHSIEGSLEYDLELTFNQLRDGLISINCDKFYKKMMDKFVAIVLTDYLKLVVIEYNHSIKYFPLINKESLQ